MRPGAALLVLGTAGLALAATASVPTNGPVVRSGVVTHFAQGWPLRLLATAKGTGAVMIRDSLHWAAAEKTPGQILFTAANSGHIDRACAAGMTVLLVIEPRNPLYDGRQTAWSPGARAAFARYVAAVAGRWPRCVAAIEIGNEINGKGGMIGPAAENRIAAHIALVRAVRAAVKPMHPGLVLLGGSVNTVAGGFLERLFRAGLLAEVDGIAIHPYRPEPEGLDAEIGRVQAAMARSGTVKPIWATEFSRDFARPEDAAPFLLKMTALLESAGVTDHYWYALADQPHFPTMGLTRFDGTDKPAAQAFQLAAGVLAPLGPARRIGHDDSALYHFRYGADAHLVWGGRRALTVRAAPGKAVRFLSAQGSALPPASMVSAAPVVILGAADLTFGPPDVLADSLYGFARPPLAWFARSASGTAIPLALTDWQWSAYLGSAATPGISVNPGGMGTTARLGTAVRYVARGAENLIVSACLKRNAAGGSGAARASLTRNGMPLWSGTDPGADTGAAGLRGTARVAVRPGDILALELMPASGAPARFRYRFRVARSAADAAPCPEELVR